MQLETAPVPQDLQILLPAIFGLLGVLVGGAITSVAKWLELRHQRKVELKNLRFQRLEQLHTDAVELILHCGRLSTDIIALCFGGITDQERHNRFMSITDDFIHKAAAVGSQVMLYTELPGNPLVQRSGIVRETGFRLVNLYAGGHQVNPVDRDRELNALRSAIKDFVSEAGEIQTKAGSATRQLLAGA